MKKQIFSILLILCLIAPVGSMITWMHFKQKAIRRQAKEKIISGMGKNELVLFVFSTEESRTKLHWNNDREFKYNDRLYDVVEKNPEGNVVSYWCWLDRKESTVEKQIRDLITSAIGKDPLRKSNRKKLVNFYKSLFFSKSLPRIFSVPMSTICLQTDRFECLNDFYPPPTPPPEKS